MLLAALLERKEPINIVVRRYNRIIRISIKCSCIKNFGDYLKDNMLIS
jgi:hypothetical protein